MKQIIIIKVSLNFLICILIKLVAAAEKNFNVTVIFNRKLIDADLEQGKLKFFNTESKEVEDIETQLIIGADGAYSTVRKYMMKKPRFNFGQTYIEHGYIEVSIPPTKDKNFVMSSNYLHIWPRGNLMMIALPNDDSSFTGNIFAPFTTFDELNTPERLLQFCNDEFPDIIPLIDKKKLIENRFEIKPKTLVSVKCEPYHIGQTALLIGDAAHAMVPFYAMGMNTGFEDVLLLDELMELYDSNLEKVLPNFSALRCKDAHAICKLAMYNYMEMRDLVTRRSFIARKYLDTFLFWLFPKVWIPLYSTVHFTRMPFKQCVSNRSWQDKVIQHVLLAIGIIVVAMLIYKML